MTDHGSPGRPGGSVHGPPYDEPTAGHRPAPRVTRCPDERASWPVHADQPVLGEDQIWTIFVPHANDCPSRQDGNIQGGLSGVSGAVVGSRPEHSPVRV